MAKNTHYIRWNVREDKMLLDLRAKGYSFYKISSEFGLTKQSIVERYRKIKPKVSDKEILRTWCCVI